MPMSRVGPELLELPSGATATSPAAMGVHLSILRTEYSVRCTVRSTSVQDEMVQVPPKSGFIPSTKVFTSKRYCHAIRTDYTYCCLY